MAHRVIHSLRELLVTGCIPLVTSDGLNLYFYALTAHFGHWFQVRRQGRGILRWQVAAGLIYGQVKKCYRRRELVRVRHVMQLGTQSDLAVDMSTPAGSCTFLTLLGNLLRGGVKPLESRDARGSKFVSIYPCHRPDQINGCSCGKMLEMSLGQANVTRSSETKGTNSL